MLASTLASLVGFVSGFFFRKIVQRLLAQAPPPFEEDAWLYDFFKKRAKFDALPFRNEFHSKVEPISSVQESEDETCLTTATGSRQTPHEPCRLVGPGHYDILLDTSGRFVDFPEEFCRTIGYNRAELLGKRIDVVTAPDTVDTARSLGTFFFFGRSKGLWMFLDREGLYHLARYEWELLPDFLIQMHCDPQRLDGRSENRGDVD